MNESRTWLGLKTRTAAVINKVCGSLLLVIGGAAIGLGWYQTSEEVIHGLRGITGGAAFVMVGLMALAEGSKTLRTFYGALSAVFSLVALYIQFWLDH